MVGTLRPGARGRLARMNSMAFAVQAVVVSLLAFASARAQTTVVIPCAADNTLYQDATGSLSNGAGGSLFVGITGQPAVRRALLRFDVAALVPPGALVLQAELALNVTQSSFAGTLDFAGHRVLASWGEGASIAAGGGGGGTLAATGDATWLHRFHPSSLWTAPGGDFAAQPSFLLTTLQTGAASSRGSQAMVADVQGWIDQPATNHGWVLKTDETLGVSRRLDSRESANTAGRPRLLVTYLLPMQSTTWGTGCTVSATPYALAVQGMPMTGNTLTLTQRSGPAGSAAGWFFALALVPNGIPLLAGCSLYLPLGGNVVTGAISTLSPTGSASLSLPLPAAAAGVFLTSQCAALDATPEGFTLSNAIALLVM